MARAGLAEMTRAPFTPEEVASLNEYQLSGVFHPFTCGHCRDADPNRPMTDEHLLVATEAGWECPTCEYRQSWAWPWTADRRWEGML